MSHYVKTSYPLDEIRRHLETGPIVLVTSRWQDRTNIMTMGWHMVMQFYPALFCCYIWEGNHSYHMIRNARECVINVPTVDLADKVVAVGNSTGSSLDKFAAFDLTPVAASQVGAPLIDECYANFECRLSDDSQIDRHGLFIWEVVEAHVATSVKEPKTMHYRGHGEFMTAGPTIDLSESFKPQNL